MSERVPGPPWIGPIGDVAEWMRRWWAPAPQTLTQPILPGWTFALTNVNSSAPQTEADVVALHSYGRQLGRLGDVVALLLDGREDLQGNAAVGAFREMLAEIEAIKADAAAARVDRLRADLATLKADDPARYERLRAELLRELGVS